MGRPAVAGKARGAIFSVRLTPEERRIVERAAGRQGRKASEWAREVLALVASLPAGD
jgi:hypothetical protein